MHRINNNRHIHTHTQQVHGLHTWAFMGHSTNINPTWIRLLLTQTKQISTLTIIIDPLETLPPSIAAR